MPLGGSESSDSSDSDEFDLKHLIQSRHLRRALMDKNPSKWAISGRGEQDYDEDDDDVASSSCSSSLNFSKIRSDWTRKMPRDNARGERRGGKMFRANVNEDEFDEMNHRDSLPTTRGPYDALQLAADRLTGGLQDDIAHQLESVEEQLEAVGLQMQEAIAAGLKDGTFKSRIRSSDVEATERQTLPANSRQPPVDSMRESASIHKIRDRGSQTSPFGMRYSTHTSAESFPRDNYENPTKAQRPLNQQTQVGDDQEPSRQAECTLVPGKREDTPEDAARSSTAHQRAADNSGYEYNILKLEGIHPDRKSSTSHTRSIVSGNSTPSDKSHKTEGEFRVYQARGCQTCRCHSCRVPSDPVQTVQIVGVVGNSQGESSGPGPREFVTMDTKNGRIPQSLGLIEICRDYEAQKGEYEHTWRQASVLQQFNIERSSTEMTFSPIKGEKYQLHVDSSHEQVGPGVNSKSDTLDEAGQSSKENSEDTASRKWQNPFLKSKFLLERSCRLQARGLGELGSVYDEMEYPAGQASPAVHRPDRVMDPSGYDGSSSGRTGDATQNIISDNFSVVDKEFGYSPHHRSDYSLQVEGAVVIERTAQESRSFPSEERNFSVGPESRSVLQMQGPSSKEDQSFKIPDLEAVKIEEARILSGPRWRQSNERRSKSNLNPDYLPEYVTRSWSHQNQQNDQLDCTTRNRDDSCNPNQESTYSDDPNKKVAASTGPRSVRKAPLLASRSSYEFIPSVGSVSSPRLPCGIPERLSSDVSLKDSRPDTGSWISGKCTEMETDEVSDRHVAQSRVYIDIRQEYEPGDHVSHQEMQRRMQDEIAKEFALLGIHSPSTYSKKSNSSKYESKLPGPSDYSDENNNSMLTDISKLEEGTSSLDNLYREKSDLRSRAGQTFPRKAIPAQVYRTPPKYSSPGRMGDVGEGASAQRLDDRRGNLGPRASATLRLATVGRLNRRSKRAQRPRFEQDEFGERHVQDSNTHAPYRRPTPYPLSVSAEDKSRKEEFLRQLQNTQKLEELSAQRPFEWTQESDQPQSTAGGGEVSVGPTSADYQGPDITKRGDALVKMLNKKSSRSGNRQRSRETSVQHIVTRSPRDRSLLLQPMSEVIDSKSGQNSDAQMERNSNLISGRQVCLGSTIRMRSQPSVLSDIPRPSPGTQSQESQDHEAPGRHPTVIDQNWNESSNLEGVQGYEMNDPKPTKRNLKTLNSKSSQKYLAKMLSRLSQKLAVLQSRGLIESQSHQHSDGPQFSRELPSESLESRDQDWSLGPSIRRQESVKSEFLQQFDHLHLRKGQDFTNLMRRRNSEWPFKRDSSIQSKDTLTMGLVDDEYSDARKIPQTSDSSTKWSHQTSRASMLANNLELIPVEIAAKRNEMSKKQELQEEWHPRTPHSLSSRDHTEGMEAKKSKHHERSENNLVITAEVDSISTYQRDFQSQMPPSSKDTPVRSFRHQTQMTENWESRNRQSNQTQTVDGISARDERQPRHGQVQVLSHQSIHHGTSSPSIHNDTFTSSETLRGLQHSSNSEELPWDRNLEQWNPRASKGSQLRRLTDDVLEAPEQFQAETRNGMAGHTEEFGLRSPPTTDPQFRDRSPSQRMDSMETQPGDLESRGSQYLQHPVPRQADSFYLYGQRDSRSRQGMEMETPQHPISQFQRIGGIQLVSEEEEFGNYLTQNQVPRQSDLEDALLRNRHLAHNQMMDSMGAQHQTSGAVGEIKFRSQPHFHDFPVSQMSEVGRMHNFAVQPDSGKPEYEPVDDFTWNRQHSLGDRMYGFVEQPGTMESASHHRSHGGGMHSHAMHPKDLDSEFPYHSQSGRMYSHEVQSEGMNLEMRHPSQSAGRYSHEVQPEEMNLEMRHPSQNVPGMNLEMRHPSQSGGMYSHEAQPRGTILEMRHPSQSGGVYSHEVLPGGTILEMRHPSQTGGIYSHEVQPEGRILGMHHASQSGGIYSHEVQPEGMNLEMRHPSQNVPGMNLEMRHPSQSGGIYSHEAQPGGTILEMRHPSQSGGIYSHEAQPAGTILEMRHPSQSGGIDSHEAQPGGTILEMRHPSQSVGIYSHEVQPGGTILEMPHPSQSGGIYSHEVQPGGTILEMRHPSQTGGIYSHEVQPEGRILEMHRASQSRGMYSHEVQPEGMNLEMRHPSQSGGMYSHEVQPEEMNLEMRHSSQSGGMYSNRVQPEEMDLKMRHTSQRGGMHSNSVQPEVMISEMRHPSQSGGMYSNRVQPDGLEARNHHGPQIRGEYGFAEHSETSESPKFHPSQRRRMPNIPVQLEGKDAGFRHQSESRRIYNPPGQAEQHEVIDYVSRRPSQRDRMPNLPVHPEVLETESRHHPRVDRMHSFAGRLEETEPENRHPSGLGRMHSFEMQPQALDAKSRRPSDKERMHSFAVKPEALDAGSGRPSDTERMHSFAMQVDKTDRGSHHPSEPEKMHRTLMQPEATSSLSLQSSRKERMYSSGEQARSIDSRGNRSSETARMHSFAVHPEVIDAGNRKPSHKRVPEIRTPHDSVVRMTENRSKEFKALLSDRDGAEKKTSSDHHPLNDLPPEVLNLGSKNPKKSSQILMLNDMLQDLEATVSKSRQNSRARKKSHMLVHEFDAVAGGKSKKLSKSIRSRVPEDEEPNLEGTQENFEPFDGEKSSYLETEKSESHDETPETFYQENFDGYQLESHPHQVDGENLRPFEDELLESQPNYEDERSDLLEGDQSGTPQDDPDYLPEEPPVEEQQDEQTDLEDSSHAVEGSDHHDRDDSLSSHRSHGSNRRSSHISSGARTSSLNIQPDSQQPGTQRRSQAQTKDVPRASSVKIHTKDEPRKSILKSHTQDDPRKSILKSHTKDEPRKSILKSHTKDDPRKSILKIHTKYEPRTSTLEGQRGSQPQVSLRRSQTQMKDMTQQPEGTDQLLQTFDIMPEELETPDASEGAYPSEELISLETEGEELVTLETNEELATLETDEDLGASETGEELVPFETGEELIPFETEDEELTLFEPQGEELTSLETEGEELASLETEGEELAPLETRDDNDYREPQAGASQTAERRETSRVVSDKDRRLKAKANRVDSIMKDFIKGGSSSRQISEHK